MSTSTNSYADGRPLNHSKCADKIPAKVNFKSLGHAFFLILVVVVVFLMVVFVNIVFVVAPI